MDDFVTLESLVEDFDTRVLVETRSLVDDFVTRELAAFALTLGLSLVDDFVTRSLVLTRPLVTRLLVGRVIGLDWLFCVPFAGTFSKVLDGNTVLEEELIFLLLDVFEVVGRVTCMGPVADFCSFSSADLALATMPVLIEPDFT